MTQLLGGLLAAKIGGNHVSMLLHLFIINLSNLNWDAYFDVLNPLFYLTPFSVK